MLCMYLLCIYPLLVSNGRPVRNSWVKIILKNRRLTPPHRLAQDTAPSFKWPPWRPLTWRVPQHIQSMAEALSHALYVLRKM